MRYYWSFAVDSATKRWQIVLREDSADLNDRARWVPGYESRNPADVIYAMLYLKSGYRWKSLTDWQISILNEIRQDAIAAGFDID